MKKRVYWLGHLSDECQLCKRSFEDTMFDAHIPGWSAWGNICKRCFHGTGSRLGVGFGQEYQKQKDGRWLKVRG